MSIRKDSFSDDIFMSSFPNILQNDSLRDPQIRAYAEAYNHFIRDKKRSHAIIVLPTGVGKTGVMGILPYFMSEGKVLIIAPRVAIKDNLVKQLDPLEPDNFWLKRKVFTSPNYLPSVCEYTPGLVKDVLDRSNIIILNVHKLQSRLDSSILNFLPSNYFDLIIIDEAHHSTAKTWTDAVSHFSKAKVVKLTGTPFRTDGEKIEGDLVYNYKLGLAMVNNYIKSLENITYIPDELHLTIDADDKKKYTIEEIYALGLKDEDWVTRTVAYDIDSSSKIVDKSIELLEKKREGTKIPHKIIAVACSIKHAEQIKELYESKKYRVAIVHSKLDEKDKDRAFSDIDNHRVDVVINVAMLGEGYDHPYLSVAAIFRPFKAELPYIQFIGRILRYIDDEDVRPIDNIGHIISHKHLELDALWQKYKKEIEESEIIKRLMNDEDINDLWEDDSDELSEKGKIESRVIELGKVYESSTGKTRSDAYIDTELLKKAKALEAEEQSKVEKLVKLLKITEEQAKLIVKNSNPDLNMKRPDKVYINTKKALDTKIRYEIVPELIVEFNLNKNGKNPELFPYFKDSRFSWIVPRVKDNAALLAFFFNHYLKLELGANRDEWTSNDFDIAYQKLDKVVQYTKEMLRKRGGKHGR